MIRLPMTRLLCALLALLLAVAAMPARADRIKEVATIAGMRGNQLVGYGLVVGLDGSGDQTIQAPFTLQSVLSMLSSLGVNVPPSNAIQLRNVAAVMVTATLPTLARPGQQLDVTVSSIGNSRSLRGGTLLMTPLRAADGQVYAVAQGSVVIAGAGAGTQNSRVVINSLSAGRVPNGATVERAVPQAIDNQFIELELKQADYTLMQKAAEAIVRRFGPGAVLPVDARTMQVRVPTDPLKRVAFMAALEETPVDSVIESARVIVNSRTGSVVMNQAVQLQPCAVAHGALTVRVNRSPTVSQPQPFSRGETTAVSNDTTSVSFGDGTLQRVSQGASLDEVVRAINMLGANPQDLMAILQAIKAAGALNADIEVI